MSEEKTKKCKHCKMDIPKDAKICPHCRKKQKSGILKWVVLILIIGVVIGAVTGEDKSADSTTKQTEASAPVRNRNLSQSNIHLYL